MNLSILIIIVDKTIMNKLTGKAKSSTMRNVLSLLVGGAIGLYFGQYFPDLYWNKVDKYVLDLNDKKK